MNEWQGRASEELKDDVDHVKVEVDFALEQEV
jgi:hypothetical protein